MNRISLFYKGIILVFWITLILCILYTPKLISNFFKTEKELSFLTFIDAVSPKVVKMFEEKTGIKVHVTYVENNDDLLAKLKITKGKGQDLFIVSDYVVKLLRDQNLLKEIDNKRIVSFKDLDTKILNRSFDPNNKYSIPLSWNIYGIAYDKNVWENPPSDSWDILFKSPASLNKDYRICMVEDPREAISIVSLYMFGHLGNINEEQLDKIKDLLVKQKQWVESYTNNRQDYFVLAGLIALTVIDSTYFRKISTETKNFSFFIPKEGSLLVVENLVVSKSTDKMDNIYKFINFLLSEEVALINSQTFHYTPSNTRVYPRLDIEKYRDIFSLTAKDFTKIDTLHDDFPRRKIEDLWLAIKVA